MAYSTINYDQNGNIYLSARALEAFGEAARDVERFAADRTDKVTSSSLRVYVKSRAKIKWRVELADKRQLRDLTTEELFKLHNSLSQSIAEIGFACGSSSYDGGIELSLTFSTFRGDGWMRGSLSGIDDDVSAVDIKLKRAFELAFPPLPIPLRWRNTMFARALIFCLWSSFMGIALVTLIVSRDKLPSWLIEVQFLSLVAWVVLYFGRWASSWFYPPFDCAIGEGAERVRRIEERRTNMAYGLMIPAILGSIFLFASVFLTKYLQP
ncbi:MAG: hypothetical protein M3O03_10805 [Pseudomonadota bacterium]|nr:hypothetical protein [Pseudomonadota bacterium]